MSTGFFRFWFFYLFTSFCFYFETVWLLFPFCVSFSDISSLFFAPHSDWILCFWTFLLRENPPEAFWAALTFPGVFIQKTKQKKPIKNKENTKIKLKLKLLHFLPNRFSGVFPQIEQNVLPHLGFLPFGGNVGHTLERSWPRLTPECRHEEILNRNLKKDPNISVFFAEGD